MVTKWANLHIISGFVSLHQTYVNYGLFENATIINSLNIATSDLFARSDYDWCVR